ncbi:MAG: adenylyl-sulfate kinase [bacterium]|nr:adenylyl-sulfate kinase [bacterium]
MSNGNIIPHNHTVKQLDRVAKNGYVPKVIWFTGLSGSGKSTLSDVFEKYLFDEGYSTYILDGDNIRSGLNRDLDFSDTSRTENIRRLGELCRLFLDAGVVILTAFISPFAKDRQTVRELVGEQNFIEVFVDCPLEVCEARDVKGLYAKARKGEIPNFTGISSPFEEPEFPDVIVKTAEMSIEEGLEVLKTEILKKFKIDKNAV